MLRFAMRYYGKGVVGSTGKGKECVCACATTERGAAGVSDTMERGDTGVA